MTQVVLRESARVAVLDGDGRVLVVHTAGDELHLPGGGVRDGETPEAAARRRLRAETGIDAERLGPRLCVVENEFERGGRRYRQRETVFTLRAGEGECTPGGSRRSWLGPPEVRANARRLRPRRLSRLLARLDEA